MPKTKIAAKAVQESKKPKQMLKEKKDKAIANKTKIIKKTAPAEGGAKEGKVRRNRPGTVVLREVKRYQKSMEMMLPRAPF